MNTLTTIKCDSNNNACGHLIQTVDIASKLKALGGDIFDNILAHLAPKSLHNQFGQPKVTYTFSREKWGALLTGHSFIIYSCNICII